GATFQASDTFAGAGAGIYSIVVKDINNCTAPESLTITQPSALLADASAGPILCNGGTATITVTGAGGTSPYQYSTNNGATFQASDTFAGAGAGIYSIVVKDANNCTAPKSLTITQPSALLADASAGPILWNGGPGRSPGERG